MCQCVGYSTKPMACFYSIKKVSDRLYVGTRPYYALRGSVMAVVGDKRMMEVARTERSRAVSYEHASRYGPIIDQTEMNYY